MNFSQGERRRRVIKQNGVMESSGWEGVTLDRVVREAELGMETFELGAEQQRGASHEKSRFSISICLLIS